jgi:amino acid transporter
MIIFLAYEGFELIANTAGDIRDPSKTLPRAYATAVIFVIALYVLVSAVTVGNLALGEIVAAKDDALAAAARPFLGQTGFTLIAVAALLSTSSAINATLYGSARISYTVAREGELPEALERKIWNRPIEGLFLVSALTLIVANLFDLNSISMMGSAGFLIVFAAVNAAAYRLRGRIGGGGAVALVGAAVCGIALAALLWQTAATQPENLWVLAALVGLAVLVEGAYRAVTGRGLKPEFDRETGAGGA